ncbi:response regulator [Thiocapsa roseopersicina]|uniref:Two component transcriptional regulator, LuxR family n=1 Tax=Thiocapsa roseopersicina TaxID=1058 RepID=A0A1H3BR10_THIRO|nr:response regulator transcription factor [Thiocapsa roseopersicina]SDX44277.1 two component transcriptional regulator, LuxR family [Thiocapsa roseopersicina]
MALDAGVHQTNTTETGRIQIVIFDDQPFLLLGVERLLADEPDIRIQASCTDGAQCLEAVRRYQPDILILDPSLPDNAGLAVLEALARDSLTTKTVIFTRSLTEIELLRVMHLGVQGVVLKQMPPEMLVQCLRKVHAGGQWHEKTSFGLAFDMMLRRERRQREVAALLTPREVELTRLVAAGFDTCAIAAQLNIAPGTVKVHLHRIYIKLGLRNRVALTNFARDKGLA